MRVGIDCIPAAAASDCSTSVSTFPNTISGCFSEIASKVGANILQGPHHSAQKSTITMSLPMMVESKFSAVSSTEAMFLSYSKYKYPRGYTKEMLMKSSYQWDDAADT